MHQPRTDVKLLDIKRENEGKHLIQLEWSKVITLIGLKKYVDNSTIGCYWETKENIQLVKKTINLLKNSHLRPKEKTNWWLKKYCWDKGRSRGVNNCGTGSEPTD